MPKKMTLEEFIEKGISIHKNKYDYSKSVYFNRDTSLIIICNKHGEFIQKPRVHIQDRCGCPKCDPTSVLGNEKFIEKSILRHLDRYDYSLVEYTKNNEKVKIICKEHGEFIQQAAAHLKGQGCPDCYTGNKKSNTKEFIEKSVVLHNELYDYSLVEYTTKKDKVKIICLDHGVFEQKASVHLSGHGCPICRNSKLERYLRDNLIRLGITFEQNKRYDDCRNYLPLPFDFYLSDMNILIECDGIQHRVPIKHFGGEERYEYQKLNDSIKNNYCVEKSIRLIRVSNFHEIDQLSNLIYKNKDVYEK
jgi:hypothetical protein